MSKAVPVRERDVIKLGREIESAAQYFAEKSSRPETYRSPGDPLARVPDRVFTDPKNFRKKIERIIKLLKDVDKETADLVRDFTFGRRDPFMGTAKNILQARELALRALIPLYDALQLTARPPATRALEEPRTAMRLAFAICGGSRPRDVRKVFRRIMQLAGIKEPSERIISAWLREEHSCDTGSRKENQRRNGK